MTGYRETVSWFVALLALHAISAGAVGAEPAVEPNTPYAYHLRIVRVSGAGADPGAALGWESNGGRPVLAPGLEAWGTPEQLAGLAKALGGERADAVTGFVVQAQADGAARFHRKVYVQDAVAELEFEARPPADGEAAHRVRLTLVDQAAPGVALAEAELRVLTDRTVAIASPSPVENDWLVLAVTLIDQRVQMESSGDASLVTDDGIEPPTLVHKVDPRYPEAARRSRLQGNVILQIVIDREGVPRAPMVLRMSEGCEELAAVAVDAVSQWRYEPARLRGKPVAVWTTVSVRFRLE